MRIALVGPTYPIRGGIAHHTTSLAIELARRHELTFLSFDGGYPRILFPGKTDRDPSLLPRRVPNEPILSGLRPLSWVRAGRRISEARPELIILPWWSPFWAPAFAVVVMIATRSRRGPHPNATAPTSPDSTYGHIRPRVLYICHNVWPHDGVNWLDRALTRLALGRADAFITHSEADAAILRTLRPGTPVEVTPLPSLATVEPVPRAESRARLGIPDGAPVILFLGFIRRYKGLAVLIRALPAVVREVPELQLLVAGEAWGRSSDIMLAATTLGVAAHVRLDDRYIPDEEVAVYLGASDVMALPYLEATQSGVVTLAAAAGLPVVASAVGGLPEAVTDGLTGLLVSPGDQDALARALIRVFKEPGLLDTLRAGTMAERGRFDWEPVMERIEGLAGAGWDGPPVPLQSD
jgi:glycosyltransferase involved in cell wall biosynthesis